MEDVGSPGPGSTENVTPKQSQEAPEAGKDIRKLEIPVADRELLVVPFFIENATRNAGYEVRRFIGIFTPRPEPKKSAMLLGRAEKVANLLKEPAAKQGRDAMEVMANIGGIFSFEELPPWGKAYDVATRELASEAASLIEGAIERFPQEEPGLFSENVGPAQSDEDLKLRESAFYGVLRRSFLFAGNMDMLMELSKSERGTRLAPAIVKAYLKGAEIARRYPYPDIINEASGLEKT